MLLAQPVLLTVLLPVLPPTEPSLLGVRHPLLFPPLRGASSRPGSGSWRVRPHGLHGHPLLMKTFNAHTDTMRKLETEGEAHLPPGRREASRTTRGHR
jgi:hypothetical protein